MLFILFDKNVFGFKRDNEFIYYVKIVGELNM